MLQHYLKIGFRNFRKNSTSSIINSLGLSLAVGCSLFVFIFMEHFLTIDQYHENGHNLFVINRALTSDNGTEIHSGTPEPLAPQLKEKLSPVVEASRLRDAFGYVRSGEKVFEEQIRFVDPGFLKMFSFPLKWGRPEALGELNTIILSERKAEKYFGEENPIGQTVSIKFFQDGKPKMASFVISGVADEFVRGSSFAFGFLVNYDQLEQLGLNNPDSWESQTRVTFIQLNDAASLPLIEQEMADYVTQYNAANSDWPLEHYQFLPFLRASREGQTVKGDIFSSPGIEGFIVLSILATIIMLLACINYVNIAIASAAYRLKEIGIRKVLGGARKQLIVQFLMENIVVCLLAITLGLLWTHFLFLPGFRTLVYNTLAVDFSDYRLWAFLITLMLIMVIGGAGYPALYISGFQPSAILKDKLRFGGKSFFRRLLLGFQYFFSYVAIMAALVLIQNDRHQRTIDWRYGKDNVLVVEVPGGEAYAHLEAQVEQLPQVQTISGASDRMGRGVRETSFEIDQERFSAHEVRVGWDYVSTMDLPLAAGRSFDRDRKSDLEQSMMVNRAFVAARGWEDAIGQSLAIDDRTYHVIGVLDDFHYQPFNTHIQPLMVRLCSEDEYRFLAVKVPQDEMRATSEAIGAIWRSQFPDDPYEFFYQSSVFDYAFQEMDMATGVISTAGTIAIFLAVIGLFGLSGLRIKSKMKEVGIRKVLGGNWQHLAMVLNKEFIVLLGLASLGAIPISHFASVALLGTLTKFPMPLSIWPFLITPLLLLGLSLLTVSGHMRQALKTNPSEVLRNE